MPVSGIKVCRLRNPPARILVVAMRFLGDALLATPLIRSLKQAYPAAEIDLLVYRNTAGMFEGNPDVERILATPNRPRFRDYLELVPRLFRQYDLAVAVQPGDRPFLYGLLASSRRVAPVVPKGRTGAWKRRFLQGFAEYDNENTHTVLQNLKLADALEVPRAYELVPPRSVIQPAVELPAADRPYAVLHPYPQWTYKQWTAEGWRRIGHFLGEAGLQVVLSGGPGDEEIEFLAELQRELPRDTLNLAGRVSLAALAGILAKADCFIGPDTGITHLAAATGVPVVALFGPTNPLKWTPWPHGYRQDRNPYAKTGDQRVNNVYLIQGPGDCVPCDLEGCDRHRGSRSACLDRLPAEPVIRILKQILRRDG